MKLRPVAYVALGGLLGVIALGLWNATHRPPTPGSPTPGLPTSPQPPPTDIAPSSGASPPDAVRDDTPRGLARAEMEDIQLMFRDFRTRMKENPVGTNAEMMQSLMGDNAVGARLGPPEGQTLNEKGELLDRWGTPYFFHQLAKDQMEIHSAGPDRTMGTKDDIVLK